MVVCFYFIGIFVRRHRRVGRGLLLICVWGEERGGKWRVDLWDDDVGLWGVTLGVVDRLAGLPALDILHDLGLALLDSSLTTVGIAVSLSLEERDQVNTRPHLLALKFPKFRFFYNFGWAEGRSKGLVQCSLGCLLI